MLGSNERLVVDASVAIKWVVPEAGSDRASTLLDHELIAPDLLFSECANILWRKLRHRLLTMREIGIAARTLEEANVTTVSAKGHLTRMVAIAAELDHPAYDAAYLAVAEAFGRRLVTADRRLIDKLRQSRSPFAEQVVLLADVQLPEGYSA